MNQDHLVCMLFVEYSDPNPLIISGRNLNGILLSTYDCQNRSTRYFSDFDMNGNYHLLKSKEHFSIQYRKFNTGYDALNEYMLMH